MHFPHATLYSGWLLLAAANVINAATLSRRDTAASTESAEGLNSPKSAAKYTFGGWCTFHVGWYMSGCWGDCNPGYDLTFQPYDAKGKKLPVSSTKQHWPGTSSNDCEAITTPFIFNSTALPYEWKIQPLSECSSAINFTYGPLDFQSPRPNDCEFGKAVDGPQITVVSCYSADKGGFSLNGGWTC